MALKGAGFVLGLLLGTSVAAYAAPLPKADGLMPQATAAEPVRYYGRSYFRRYRARFHRGPYWEQDLLGHWRYVGPNSNRTNTHLF